MTRKLLITAAALLAGTAIAAAQTNGPPGSRTQDQRQNEEIGKPPQGDDALSARAQGQLPRGMQTPAEIGPKGKMEPPGGAFQDEKQNEEVGKPPNGR